MDSHKDHDQRWDMHTDRQVAASKGGATAVTVLNSGSWLALLSQAGKLTEYGIRAPIFLWGFGALLGTLLWLFIYRGTLLQWEHDYDRKNEKSWKQLDWNIRFGVSVAVASLICFGAGVYSLAIALS